MDGVPVPLAGDDLLSSTSIARNWRERELEQHTPILFINYPFSYEGVQRTIEESGKRLGVPVISSLSSFWRARADGHEKSELIVQAAGPHPRGLLHGYLVEDLMPHVSRALAPILHEDP